MRCAFITGRRHRLLIGSHQNYTGIAQRKSCTLREKRPTVKENPFTFLRVQGVNIHAGQNPFGTYYAARAQKWLQRHFVNCLSVVNKVKRGIHMCGTVAPGIKPGKITHIAKRHLTHFFQFG